MRRGKRRFRWSSRIERQVLLGIFMLGGVGGGASFFIHPAPDIPVCASEPAKQELVRSLDRTAPRQAAQRIVFRRIWSDDRTPADLVVEAGGSRHCGAVAEVSGRRPQVIRYNIEPNEQPPGYRVAVFEDRPPG